MEIYTKDFSDLPLKLVANLIQNTNAIMLNFKKESMSSSNIFTRRLTLELIFLTNWRHNASFSGR